MKRGCAPQGSRRGRQHVIATKGKAANVEQLADRTNVSALVVVSAAESALPPFFILPGVNIGKSVTSGATRGAMFAASPSSFLSTNLFVQYFEWFVEQLKGVQRPVRLLMDG